MKDCIVFLHGRYERRHDRFYRSLARGKEVVAVDGGYRAVRRIGLVPKLLIGDFDSLPRVPRRLPKVTEVIAFPKAKDKTDAQLALEYCLEHGVQRVDLVDPSAGDLDHLLGNLFLLTLPLSTPYKRRTCRVRIINPRHEVILLADDKTSYVNTAGDGLSVIPISPSIRLTCRGVEYPVERALIRRGQTRSLRNLICASCAMVAVKGQALVVRSFRDK